MNASENTRTDATSRPSDKSGTTPETSSVTLPTASASLLKAQRKRRARKLLIRVLALVVLPTLLSLVYYGFWASAEFESTCVFVIEHREPLHSGELTDDASAKQRLGLEDSESNKVRSRATNGKADREDAQIAQEYILSRDMFDELERKLKIGAHYGSAHVDVFSRLASGSSHEAAYQYLSKKLHVVHDPGAAAITVRLRAFDGKTAAAGVNVILESAEAMLNRLSQTAREDKIALLTLEANRLKQRLLQASKSLDNAPLLSGISHANVAGSKSNARTAPATERAEAPSAHLTSQKAEQERLAQRVAQAEERLQQLRDEAAQKDRYVVRVAGPSLPDEATYPLRGRAVLATLLFSALAMGILSLLFSAIREHTNL